LVIFATIYYSAGSLPWYGLFATAFVAFAAPLILVSLIMFFVAVVQLVVLVLRSSGGRQPLDGVGAGTPVTQPASLYRPFDWKRALFIILATSCVLALVVFATIWYDVPPMLSATILTGVFVAGLFLVWPPRTGWRRPLITTLVFVAIGGAAFAWLDHTHPA
jgi:hypothetical protein